MARARVEVAVDGDVRVRAALPLPAVGPGASAVVRSRSRCRRTPPTRSACSPWWSPSVARSRGPRGFELARVQVLLPPGGRRRAAGIAGRDESADGAHRRGTRRVRRTDRAAAPGVAEPVRPERPQLALWRAPTDNDGLKLADLQDLKPLGRWRTAGLDDAHTPGRGGGHPQAHPATRRRRHGRRPRARGTGAHVITQRERWKRFADGSVVVAEDVVIPDDIDDLPRIGVRWDLPAELDHVTWYGRGPTESYPDRRRGAPLGRYTGTVAEQYVPYVMPQEHGGHADTRWGVVHDAAGWGLLVTAADPFQWNVSMFTPEQLTAAVHAEELVAGAVASRCISTRGTAASARCRAARHAAGVPHRSRPPPLHVGGDPVHVRRDDLAAIAAALRAPVPPAPLTSDGGALRPSGARAGTRRPGWRTSGPAGDVHAVGLGPQLDGGRRCGSPSCTPSRWPADGPTSIACGAGVRVVGGERAQPS